MKWVQVFRGIFTGLQLTNVSVQTCVKDAEQTVAAFEKAFDAFEDRAIFKGMNLMGTGLGYFVSEIKDCKIATEVVTGLEKFVNDLLSCVKGG